VEVEGWVVRELGVVVETYLAIKLRKQKQAHGKHF
jgi:hypothetical protein